VNEDQDYDVALELSGSEQEEEAYSLEDQNKRRFNEAMDAYNAFLDRVRGAEVQLEADVEGAGVVVEALRTSAEIIRENLGRRER
jgi:hypothetical protein